MGANGMPVALPPSEHGHHLSLGFEGWASAPDWLLPLKFRDRLGCLGPESSCVGL